MFNRTPTMSPRSGSRIKCVVNYGSMIVLLVMRYLLWFTNDYNLENGSPIGAIESSSTTSVLCTEGILDRRSFNYHRQSAAGYWGMDPKKNHSCRAHRYTRPDAIQCLDEISSDPERGKRVITFAFVGDSRIRQQFYYFVKVSIFIFAPMSIASRVLTKAFGTVSWRLQVNEQRCSISSGHNDDNSTTGQNCDPLQVVPSHR